ncbi:MAG: hypothetical protein CM1200mP30_21950 [Pseudomonadota bacterium]|nr:MAG: hypothetical protein CM1200mP30_21950 [Pseudomonadota bacterium]
MSYTSRYEMPTYSTIKNAAAPIIGGVSCPFVEAATSTAPAFNPGTLPVSSVEL